MTRESMTITNRSTTALLARVTGAVLIAIAFIAIANTPLSPRTAAQTAAGYRVDSRSADGLYATIFTTPHGTIKVNLPDAMVAGDTISGPIYMGEYLNAKFTAKRHGYPGMRGTILVPSGPPLAN